VFDIYTIIFLALAVFIFLRLRSVLGQRTGRERPPYDPYSARDTLRTPSTDKVVTLPTRRPETEKSAEDIPPVDAGRASRRRVLRSPKALTASRPRTAASMRSISSPARGPLTK
jgi:predicted lipid-binding transport protein (Tim44 family)